MHGSLNDLINIVCILNDYYCAQISILNLNIKFKYDEHLNITFQCKMTDCLFLLFLRRNKNVWLTIYLSTISVLVTVKDYTWIILLADN